jgi:hypothetical protein
MTKKTDKELPVEFCPARDEKSIYKSTNIYFKCIAPEVHKGDNTTKEQLSSITRKLAEDGGYDSVVYLDAPRIGGYTIFYVSFHKNSKWNPAAVQIVKEEFEDALTTTLTTVVVEEHGWLILKSGSNVKSSFDNRFGTENLVDQYESRKQAGTAGAFLSLEGWNPLCAAINTVGEPPRIDFELIFHECLTLF